jgi:hypothetical protein
MPEVVFDYNLYPDLAENIWNAQKAGHPEILTHGANRKANRFWALNRPGIPRILSRDEYPFASSMEGGAGSWVGHVPAWQNNAQGAILKNFFNRYNIKQGTKYRVRVANYPE